MIEAVGYRFWPTYFAHARSAGARRAAGSRSRPSPCRTTGCWPPATRTPGSRSTSSPAGCCRRSRRSARDHRAATPRLRTVDMISLRPHYAETLRLWRERFVRAPRRGVGVGLRRRVPADVGAVPGVLGGRLPVRLSRRLPVDVRTDGRADERRTSSSSRPRRCAALVVVHAITFAIGRRIGRYNVVDVTWGVGFVAVAAVAAVVGTGDLFRRLLLLALVAVWGLRLAWHMSGKSAGKGEDPRYADLLRGDFSARRAAQDLPDPGRSRPGSSRCRCSCRRSPGRRPSRCWPRPGAGRGGVAGRRVSSRPSAITSCGCSRPIPPTRA